jgi:hypothetical protein
VELVSPIENPMVGSPADNQQNSATNTDLRNTKVRKPTFHAGPLSKADIGQNINRFAQKMQAKKESTIPAIETSERITTFGANVEESNELGSEVQMFFVRKNQLGQIGLQAKDELKESLDNTDTYVPPSIITKEISYKIIKVESDQSPLIIEDEKNLNSQEDFDTGSSIVKNGITYESNPTLQNESESKEELPSLPKKAEDLVLHKSIESDELKTEKAVNSLESLQGDEIVPENEQNSPVESVEVLADKNTTQISVKNLPSLIITNIFQYNRFLT